jgi:hypothetical protein
MKKSKTKREEMILAELARRDMTPKDLAEAIGRGLTTVKSWISGESIPELTPEETKFICEFMGWSLDDLVRAFPGFSKRRQAIKDSHAIKRTETIEENKKKGTQE